MIFLGFAMHRSNRTGPVNAAHRSTLQRRVSLSHSPGRAGRCLLITVTECWPVKLPASTELLIVLQYAYMCHLVKGGQFLLSAWQEIALQLVCVQRSHFRFAEISEPRKQILNRIRGPQRGCSRKEDKIVYQLITVQTYNNKKKKRKKVK